MRLCICREHEREEELDSEEHTKKEIDKHRAENKMVQYCGKERDTEKKKW